jgi:hypothetical protein
MERLIFSGQENLTKKKRQFISSEGIDLGEKNLQLELALVPEKLKWTKKDKKTGTLITKCSILNVEENNKRGRIFYLS